MEQTFGLDLSRKFMTTAEIKKISQNKKNKNTQHYLSKSKTVQSLINRDLYGQKEHTYCKTQDIKRPVTYCHFHAKL